MKKLLLLILFVFLLTSLQGQHLFSGRSVKRGEVLKAYVYPSDKILNSRFSLINSTGRVVSDSFGFKVNIDESVIETALLGIPSDLEPGKYLLKVHCETREGSDQFSKAFFISEREFINEDISLNRSMTKLRSSENPQKAEQSRHLWTIISNFDKLAVYQKEKLHIPVEEYIESAFYGDRRNFNYSDGTSSRSLHSGSDFAAVTGTPVYAAGAGKIVLVENRIITGNTVIIEHLPGVYTLYYHMDSTDIELGMVVEKGRQIGKVGATGLVTGAHLHWELRVSKVAVDPLLYTESSLIDKEEILNIIGSIH